MKFNNFIWDFDGTLFNTYPATLDSFIITLKEFGINNVSREQIYIHTRKTITFALEVLMEEHSLNEDFLKKFWHNTNSIHPKNNIPFENAIYCCEKIKKNGLKNFIITHRDKKTTHEILKHYGAFELFEEIITEDDGFEKKPDPESFIYTIKKYKLELSKTLGIGDRELDIKAGRNSGIKTCFMNFDSNNDLLGAYFAVESFNEFIYKFL